MKKGGSGRDHPQRYLTVLANLPERLCIVEGQKASIALPDCTGYRTP